MCLHRQHMSCNQFGKRMYYMEWNQWDEFASMTIRVRGHITVLSARSYRIENPPATSRYSEHRGPSTNHITRIRPSKPVDTSPSAFQTSNHIAASYKSIPKHLSFATYLTLYSIFEQIVGPFVPLKVCANKSFSVVLLSRQLFSIFD